MEHWRRREREMTMEDLSEGFKTVLLAPEYENITRKILEALDGMSIFQAQEILEGISASLLLTRVDHNLDGNA